MADKIGEAILELRTDVRKLTQGMNKARQTADKSMKQMETRAEKFSKIMKGAAALGGLTIAFAGVARAMKRVFDVGQYAAAQRQTSMAFKSIAEDAGEMANDIINNMRRMSGETISELDMMLAANKASLLGIPVKEFDKLMAIARASATATGGSVQKMFEDIVTGIGRASPMILDNLGITVKIGDANQKYADSLGKTVEQLTDAEKKQGLLNAVLMSGEDIIRKVGEAGQTLTDVERWQQVQAAAADFKAELGTGLLPIMGKIFEATTEVLRSWTDASKAAREYNELMKAGLESNKGASEQLRILAAQLEKMNKAAMADRVGGVNTRERDAIKARITALKEQLHWEEMDQAAIKAGNEAEAARAKTEAAAAAVRAQNAQELIDWLKIINDKYGETEEGRRAALDAEIAYFEAMSEGADKTLPKFQAVLEMLYEQRDTTKEVIEEEKIMLEEHMSAAEALSIMAAEAYLIEQEAIEAAMEKQQGLIDKTIEFKDLLEGMASDTIVRYGEAFGSAIEDSVNLHQALREAMKETIAIALESQAKLWAIEAAASYAKAWTNIAELPKAIGLTGASIAALAGAGFVRSLETGGDFETRGPQMIMVGDNPGGRERVSVTPTSSPNINGPGQMVHVTFNLGSRTLYDDISRAADNGELIINPRSVRR